VPSATFDTNIYISALIFKGTPLRLLHLAIDGDLDVVISQPILDEMLRVLREKFGWPEERLRETEALINGFARRVVPSQTLHVIAEDPADNRILECATEAGSEYIVTGDKDLHRLGHYGSARVIKAADMLDVVLGVAWRTQQRT
jgi:putative PIN family toxin of toxin-antitoxin system